MVFGTKLFTDCSRRTARSGQPVLHSERRYASKPGHVVGHEAKRFAQRLPFGLLGGQGSAELGLAPWPAQEHDELPGHEAILRKEGRRLVVEPVARPSLLAVLATLKPLDEELPRIVRLPAEPVDL